MVPSRAKWSLYWLARHKPYGIVLVTGLLLAASFPPSPLNFLIYIAFVPLFVLFETEVVPSKVPEDKIFRPYKSFFIVLGRILTLQFIWRKATRFTKVFSYRRKVISGNAQLYRYTYAIFLLWNLLCCYWLSLTALGAGSIGEGILNATAGILAVTLNPALMSIPFQFYSRVRWSVHPYLAAGCLILFWIAFEYLHFNWDLSWSWLTLGHALSPWPGYIQYAELTGVLGVSLHILVGNLLLYVLYRRFFYLKRFFLPGFGAAVAWFVLPFVLHLVLLNPSRDILQTEAGLKVRIVQPNIDPFLKYNYYTPTEQVQHFADLILENPLDSIDLIVLPETAIPRPHNLLGLQRSRILQPLWAIVDSFQVPILTGFEEYRIFESKEEAPASARQDVRGFWVDNYNSATILRPDHRMDSYQKSKLVPMVERMPFLDLLSGLKAWNLDLGTGMGGYGLPDTMKSLAVNEDLNVGMMICYESEYADFVRHTASLGADFLAIITNDGWWSQSSGYIQHAHMASLRAIENRRAIVRSANTGTSLFVDVTGRTSGETDWWTPCTVDGEIRLYSGTTFYAKHGDYVGRIAFWLSLLVILGGLTGYYIKKYRRRAL